MKPLFILFVMIHLLADLAMPSLPGAFRFNPDESAVAVRVEPFQAQDLKPVSQVDLLREAFQFPRLELRIPVFSHRRSTAPDLIVTLPRRDPSSDRPLPRPAEDH